MIFADLAASSTLRAVILRYFNPIGSDPYLRSGVYLRDPSHVLGQIVMAARGQREAFMVTGTDYPTRDGTGCATTYTSGISHWHMFVPWNGSTKCSSKLVNEAASSI